VPSSKAEPPRRGRGGPHPRIGGRDRAAAGRPLRGGSGHGALEAPGKNR